MASNDEPRRTITTTGNRTPRTSGTKHPGDVDRSTRITVVHGKTHNK